MFYVFRRYLVHITKLPFHVFDKYEIHIQAFLDFINGKSIISDPHLHKHIYKIYTQHLYVQIFSQKAKSKNGGSAFQNYEKYEVSDSQI